MCVCVNGEAARGKMPWKQSMLECDRFLLKSPSCPGSVKGRFQGRLLWVSAGPALPRDKRWGPQIGLCKLGWNSHKSNHFKASHSEAFNIFTELCHYIYLGPKQFLSPPSSPRQSRFTFYLCALIYSGLFHGWNPARCGLLCLASCTQPVVDRPWIF